jgi:hypothetical protein
MGCGNKTSQQLTLFNSIFKRIAKKTCSQDFVKRVFPSFFPREKQHMSKPRHLRSYLWI